MREWSGPSEPAETIIAPSLVTEHRRGKNVLYCGSFALAWKMLQDLLGEPLRLTPETPLAEALRGAVSAGVIDDASCVARAGFGRDGILQSIRDDLVRRFGPGTPDSLPGAVGPEDLVLYAMFRKTLAFEVELVPWELDFFFAGCSVRAFGVIKEMDEESWARRSRQIIVRDYQSPSSFVLELVTRSAEDRLMVTRTAPSATLAETVERAFERATGAPEPPLDFSEEVLIPHVRISASRHYDELEGRRVTGSRGTVVALREARQDIELCLDERGAALKSEALLVAVSSPVRSFVCDGPFLVSLHRSGEREPYFAAWVENAELLVPRGAR